jgi:hypothetical protein
MKKLLGLIPNFRLPTVGSVKGRYVGGGKKRWRRVRRKWDARLTWIYPLIPQKLMYVKPLKTQKEDTQLIPFTFNTFYLISLTIRCCCWLRCDDTLKLDLMWMCSNDFFYQIIIVWLPCYIQILTTWTIGVCFIRFEWLLAQKDLHGSTFVIR